MRLTIARKLATAAIVTVVLCLAAMSSITSRNLERGFIDYLNESQAKPLDDVRDVLAEQYRLHGSFAWLRDDPGALGRLLEQRRQDPQPAEPEPPAEDDAPPPEGLPPPPPRQHGTGDANQADELPMRPPPRRGPDAPARLRPRPRPPAVKDPLGFGPRLTVFDEQGRPVVGPPHPEAGMTRNIEVDGKLVGRLNLLPMRQISENAARGFVQGQIRDMLWVAVVLLAVSTLLAFWLARRLLRPVAALRAVTENIARGKLDARAPQIGQDELADLAQHINTMAAALEANEKQRRKVLADVSHELRTPLSVMRGEIEALQDGIRQADANALASLHHEALRLNKLVDDLYQLALADSGGLHYRKEMLDLVELTRDMAESFEVRAGKAGLRLVLHLPQNAVMVHADAGRLGQVLTNLLENSMRYTDAGGSVMLALRTSGVLAELSIEDSAPGVPDGAHRQLFERLYRVDQARSRHCGGSGLGLAICKSLVEAHGGTIVALPSSLGGVKMLIHLPLEP